MPTHCHSSSSSSARPEQVQTLAAKSPRTDGTMSDCETRSTDSEDENHDETYYLATGDASLCLDGVVFKVHKAIFSRDPDSHAPSTNGQLFEGSAEDFRAFCLLQCRPYEIHMQTSPDVGYVNVPRLLRVASVAKRHHLHKLRAWALDVVFGLCLDGVDAEGKRSSYVDSDGCTAEMLCRIFSMAKSEGRTDVVKRLLDNMDIELESDESESVSPRGTGSDSDGEWVDFEAIMDGPPMDLFSVFTTLHTRKNVWATKWQSEATTRLMLELRTLRGVGDQRPGQGLGDSIATPVANTTYVKNVFEDRRRFQAGPRQWRCVDAGLRAQGCN